MMRQMLDKNKLNVKKEDEKSSGNEANMANFIGNLNVFLETLKAKNISTTKSPFKIKLVACSLFDGVMKNYCNHNLHNKIKRFERKI